MRNPKWASRTCRYRIGTMAVGICSTVLDNIYDSRLLIWIDMDLWRLVCVFLMVNTVKLEQLRKTKKDVDLSVSIVVFFFSVVFEFFLTPIHILNFIALYRGLFVCFFMINTVKLEQLQRTKRTSTNLFRYFFFSLIVIYTVFNFDSYFELYRLFSSR